ncbi:MAG TPA: hypothetical protein PKH89_10835 [Anaerolineae bacterium]|nr:hypothetical protein [Anaerolineae bacterium]
MSPLWLSGVPLAGAVAAALLQRWRRPTALASAATLVSCLAICRSLPSQSSVVFLQQTWTLTASTQVLLTSLYVTTAILLAIGCCGQQTVYVVPAMLASLGVLGAALLLRSTWLSLVVLAAAMLLPALGSLPAGSPSARGATRYLIWVTLPIPFLLAVPSLLEQVSVHPQEMESYGRCAWLLVPAALCWLNLFPLDAAMALWANDSAPLMPAFVWLVQQVAALHMLLAFWQGNPLLWTPPVALLLRAFALLTTLLAGVAATLQLSLSAIVGSVAMATLGLAVLGIVNGTTNGLQVSGLVLAGRSAAVLLACAALQVAYQLPPGGAEPSRAVSRAARFVPLAIVWVALASAVLLPWASVAPAGTSALSALATGEVRLSQLWLISVIGVLVGVGRTSWSLWRSRLCRSTDKRGISALVLIGFLVVFVVLVLNPQALARIAAYTLPF